MYSAGTTSLRYLGVFQHRPGFTHRCLSRLYRQPIAVDRVHSARGHVVIDGSAGTI